MPTQICDKLGSTFATSPKVHICSPHYMVTASTEHGSTAHTFVTLDCAVAKIRECCLLGMSHMTITVCDTPGV